MSLVPRYQDMKYFNFVNVSIPFKTNKPSFCLILKASHALVCSVYHLGININASDEASLNVTSSFRSFIISRNSLIWLLLDIVSSKDFLNMASSIFFQISMLRWPVSRFWWMHFANFRLALLCSVCWLYWGLFFILYCNFWQLFSF